MANCLPRIFTISFKQSNFVFKSSKSIIHLSDLLHCLIFEQIQVLLHFYSCHNVFPTVVIGQIRQPIAPLYDLLFHEIYVICHTARKVNLPLCSVLCSVKRRTFALRSLISNCTSVLNSLCTALLASCGWSRRLANSSTSHLISSCSLVMAVIEALLEWVFRSIVLVAPSNDHQACETFLPNESPFLSPHHTMCV